MPDISSVSISSVWLSALSIASERPHQEVMNLNVTVNELDRGGPEEDSGIRSNLDAMLLDRGKGSVETVANTIFPLSLWNPRRSKEALFQRYMKAFPKIRRFRGNRRGTYFERMINYPTN